LNKYDVLKKYFGYEAFRHGQEEIIDSILDGQDTLAIMPTGSGKSACFQVPTMLLDGITLVISPLISLMKDQVLSLNSGGISAAFINSTLTNGQYQKVLVNVRNNQYKLIYIAPERLLNPSFLALCNDMNVSMVSIDEAHCVSQWGQNFRPSYLDISTFINGLKTKPIISAFTATATGTVSDDIVKLLGLKRPLIKKTGFDRPNLYFEVRRPKDNLAHTLNFLKTKSKQGGIIYCSTRKNVEQLCDRLNAKGYAATRYHAGLSEEEREENQNDFIYDRKRIMVATNAFGMGIDKSNVSFVVHYNMPKNIESYYQEAGRAGRDGTDAYCLLLFSPQDVSTNQYLINNATPDERLDPADIEKIKEKDRARLKQMTAFCRTKKCLRAYIITYFGDTAKEYCGNCINCKTNFETVDITVEAQKILSCVARMKEKFGTVKVVDTLRGSKSKNIISFKLDKLSTYGIMRKVSKQDITDIINTLIEMDYLFATNSEFPVLKLTENSGAVLHGRVKVTMQKSKEEMHEIREVIENYDDKLKNANPALFDALKVIRKEIADKKGVPAFVVFSNATLLDMCAKKPTNSEAFLTVSGVGVIKLEAYGKTFIEAIKTFL